MSKTTLTEDEKRAQAYLWPTMTWAQKRWAEDPVLMASKVKKYRDENPDKMRDLSLRYYGISAVQFDEIHAQQKGECAICQKSIPAVGKGRHLDHCHKTNEIRGILCVSCNFGLGNFKDNPESLQKAIHYLKTARTGFIVANPERLNRPNSSAARRAKAEKKKAPDR